MRGRLNSVTFFSKSIDLLQDFGEIIFDMRVDDAIASAGKTGADSISDEEVEEAAKFVSRIEIAQLKEAKERRSPPEEESESESAGSTHKDEL